MFYFAVLIFKSYDERSMQTAVSATLCETDCGFPNGPLCAAQVNTANIDSEALLAPTVALKYVGKNNPVAPVSLRSAQPYSGAQRTREERKKKRRRKRTIFVGLVMHYSA